MAQTRKEIQKRWYARNREKKLAYCRQYRIDNLEVMRDRDREFRKKHPERAVLNARSYRATVNGKLKSNLCRKINMALHGTMKSQSTVALTGCSMEFLRGYLQAKFLPGMTWENYGKFGWHIDHKRPCASFDLSDPFQKSECFHYTNLQPLWAQDNHSMGARF